MNATAMQVEKRVYRFDEFLADPVRRVLLRDGEAVPITPKAFSILLVLLEHQGQVVGKDELTRQVWAGHVSDANLTQNVSSLRKALGERAGDGRYVVTVPGQGYCFAAPVELLEEEPVPSARPQPLPPSPAIVAADETPAPAAPVAPAAVPKPGLRLVAGLLVLALVLGLSWWISHLDRGPLAPSGDEGRVTPPSRPSVAVLGFRDLSDRADTRWLGTALAEMLTTELAAGTDVRVISRENVTRARRFVDIEASGGLAGDSLARIRSIVGADRVLVGTYLVLPERAPQGSARRIRLDVRVLRASDGDVLASLAETGSESELFDLVTRAGARLHQALGYVAPSPEQARSARAVQPADPEALRLYSLGLDRLRSYDALRALDALEQAAEADPRSAVIRSALSQALDQLGYDVRAREEAQKAVELAAGAPREVRLGMEARLQALNREWERASATYRSLWTFYPDDLEYGLQLATALMRANQGGEAMEIIAALRRLPASLREDPRIDLLEANIAGRISDRATEMRAADAALVKGRRSGETLIVAQALGARGNALRATGRIEPAIAALREARRLAETDGHPYILGMTLASLGAALQRRGDLDEAERVHREALAIAERLGSSRGMAWQLQMLGTLHQQRGELTEAADLLERALPWHERIGDRMNEARTLAALGLVLAARGDLDGAKARLERALEISRSIGNRRDEAAALSHLGQVLERKGDLAEALRQHEQAFAVLRQLDEPGQAAEALVESASALSRLGDVAGARWRLKLALHAYRRLGNRLGMAEVLDRLSGLEYRTGDLAASRRLGDLELQIARETGSTALLGEALRRSARTDWAMGRLAEARRDFERALSLRLQEGEEAEAMGIRLDLTRLALSEGRHDEAVRLAGAASEWYASREMAGNEAQARSLLAEALLRQGRLAAAQEAAARARDRVGQSQDREMHVLVAARLARVDAAGGDPGKGIRELRQRIPDAQAAGYVNAVLQARLALGELLLAAGEAEAGRTALLEVSREAGERGFALIARRADVALDMGGGFAGWKG